MRIEENLTVITTRYSSYTGQMGQLRGPSLSEDRLTELLETLEKHAVTIDPEASLKEVGYETKVGGTIERQCVRVPLETVFPNTIKPLVSEYVLRGEMMIPVAKETGSRVGCRVTIVLRNSYDSFEHQPGMMGGSSTVREGIEGKITVDIERHYPPVVLNTDQQVYAVRNALEAFYRLVPSLKGHSGSNRELRAPT